ncbi:ACT domain-containing protein [Nocardiopsis nanhaiensis]
MDVSSSSHGTDDRHGFFGREVLEMGTLLFAAGAAHLVVVSLGHSDSGMRTLIALGVLLLAFSALHRWHRHRRTRRQDTSRATAPEHPRSASPVEDRLWSVRVTVADVPGGLAALTGRFAALGVDIRLMQVHPDGPDAVDEFFVSAPAIVGETDLHRAVRDAGGRDAVVRTADVHELSDTTSRTLTMVDALISGTADLERCLLALAAAQDVRHVDSSDGHIPREELSGTAMTLPSPDGALTVYRVGVPFTPVEFARCRALAQVACSLRDRAPERTD